MHFCFAVEFLFFAFDITNPYYFLGFFFGYFLNKFLILNKRKILLNSFFRKVNWFFYHIQNYSYSFFLIHGGILKLVFAYFSFQGLAAFVSSFVLTAIISVYHKNFTDYLLDRISPYEEKFTCYIENVKF